MARLEEPTRPPGLIARLRRQRVGGRHAQRLDPSTSLPALVAPARARVADRWMVLAAAGIFLLLAFRQSAVVPGTLGSTWSFLIAIATGAIWVVSRLADRGAPRLIDGAFLTGSFYLATSLISTGWGLHYGLPYGASATNMDLVMLRDAILLTYFGFLLSNLVTLEAVELMVGAIVVGVAISSFYALVNIATGFDPASVIVPPLTKGGGRTLVENLLREGMLRPAGAAGHPLELSFLVTLVFPLALAVLFSAKARHRPIWPWLLCCFLIGATLLSGLSRSAIIGSAAALIAMSFYWSRHRLSRVAVGLVGGAALVLIARPSLFGTILSVFVTSDKDDSLHSRGRALAYSADMLAESPLFGCGHGCLVEPFHPVLDDQFLGRLIEGGFLGLFSFVLLLLAPLYKTARAASLFDRHGTPAERTAREISIGLLGSLVAITVINLVLDTAGFVQAWTTMWVVIALAWTMRRLAARTYDENYGLTVSELRELSERRGERPDDAGATSSASGSTSTAG